MHHFQRCDCCHAFPFQCRKLTELKTSWCWLDEKNPHIRKTRDGTNGQVGFEQRSVLNGHVDLSLCDRSTFQLTWTVSGQTAFDKFVRPAALCGGEEAEISQFAELKQQN